MAKNKKPAFLRILLILLLLAAIWYYRASNTSTPAISGDIDALLVTFIDVGQGDATLISLGGKYMLIDAGTNESEDDLISFLKKQGVDRFSFVIGTHPHEDHIGGLDKVIKEFPIDTLIMPNAQANTKTFSSVLDAAEAASLRIKAPKPGTKYAFGDAEFTILAPNSATYKELNNYSVGLRLVYQKTSFLFTGDAEKASEKEMLANGLTLSSDVMKAAHHGSDTSNTKDFLAAVRPSIVVISCGKDNTYKHPSEEALERFEGIGARIYRTDKSGSISLASDGKNIEVKAGNEEGLSGHWLPDSFWDDAKTAFYKIGDTIFQQFDNIKRQLAKWPIFSEKYGGGPIYVFCG